MAIDRWFIGGGAEHTPESARRLVYASTGGAEGVCGVKDLEVVPLETPGQGVRVRIGSALILSRYVGGETQTYMGTVYEQESVSITPTGSGSARSDLVVLRVEDPFAAGSRYDKPSEVTTAPYVHVRVISGVPANTTRLQDVPGHQNDTGIALARIDLPKSTGTVDNITGKIVNLRKIAQPRRSEVVFARPRVGADDTNQIYLTATVANGGEYFPGGGGSPNDFKVFVPEWATHMIIDARWMSVYYKQNPHGRYWMEYGDEFRDRAWPNKQQWEFATQHFNFNAPNTGADEKISEWSLMDTRTIPAKLRGKYVTFVFKAGLTHANMARQVWMNWSGGLGCRITFSEGLVDQNIL